jgi:hypothetical protein
MATVKASVRKPVTGKGQLSVKESIFRFIKLGTYTVPVPTNETVNRSTSAHISNI